MAKPSETIVSGTGVTPYLAAIILTAVFVIATVVFAVVGFWAQGWWSAVAVVVAASICWVSGLAALGLTFLFRSPRQVVHAVGLAMLMRMGIPLLAGIVLSSRGGPLAEAGVFGMIVGFYLLGLFVETLLAVRLVAGSKDVVAKAV